MAGSSLVSMIDLQNTRRTFLIGIGSLGMGQMLPQATAQVPGPAHSGSVLGTGEGEHLLHFRDGGDIFIHASAANGSTGFAQGTQQVKKGTGIPIHRHFVMDEAFYVLEGSGTVILNDARHAFGPGSSVLIPKNTWHGLENPDREVVLLWTVAPGGLEGFFRETCSAPGAPPKHLSREQIREIARKYGTEFR